MVAAAAALGAVAVAAVVRVIAGTVMDQAPNYMSFYPAVLFATLVAGARGGLLATIISAALVAAIWQTNSPLLYSAIFCATAIVGLVAGAGVRVVVWSRGGSFRTRGTSRPATAPTRCE